MQKRSDVVRKDRRRLSCRVTVETYRGLLNYRVERLEKVAEARGPWAVKGKAERMGLGEDIGALLEENAAMREKLKLVKMAYVNLAQSARKAAAYSRGVMVELEELARQASQA